MGYTVHEVYSWQGLRWESVSFTMCNFIYANGSLKEQCHEICGFHYVQFRMCKRKLKGTVPWDFWLQVFSCISFSKAPEYCGNIHSSRCTAGVAGTGANLPPVSLIPVAKSHRRQIWHQRQIWHRWSWHRRQISHWCHGYQWCTLTCEYLRAEFLEKFETTLILFSGAWKKSIHGKNLKQKISWHCPFQAKYQRTQKCNDITSQHSIKILSFLRLSL